MPLQSLKRLMFALAAFAILSGAMAAPVRAVAAHAAMTADAKDGGCEAMKMQMPCSPSKSDPCKMSASDCAKMTVCCDTLPGTEAQSVVPAEILDSVSISYGETSGAFRGRRTDPALFPPKAI